MTRIFVQYPCAVYNTCGLVWTNWCSKCVPSYISSLLPECWLQVAICLFAHSLTVIIKGFLVDMPEVIQLEVSGSKLSLMLGCMDSFTCKSYAPSTLWWHVGWYNGFRLMISLGCPELYQNLHFSVCYLHQITSSHSSWQVKGTNPICVVLSY